MKRATAVVGLLGALLVGACSKSASNSLVLVKVSVDASLPTMTQLKAELHNAGSTDIEHFPPLNSGVPLTFDTSFALSFSTSRSGRLEIVVTGLDAASQPVASGAKTVDIAVGGRAEVAIRLTAAGTLSDAGAGDTLGGRDEVGPSPNADGSVFTDVPTQTDGLAPADLSVKLDGPPAADVQDRPDVVARIDVASPDTSARPDAGGVDTPVSIDAGAIDMPVIRTCGNGFIDLNEICDDGDTLDGNGCSSRCHIEPGYDCPIPGQACLKAICGNGKLENGEACDLGSKNGLFYGDGKGCSKTCTKEPLCRDSAGKNRACDVVCGDGNLNSGEDCDDGNLRDGDGCSKSCTKEDGFTCSVETLQDGSPCASGSGQCLALPVIYRDFQPQNLPGGHPDFLWLGTKDSNGDVVAWCQTNSVGPSRGNDGTARCWGIAADNLINGKPQPGPTTMCPCLFTDWDLSNISHIPGGYLPSDSPLYSGTGYRADVTLTAIGIPTWTGLFPAYKDAASFKQWFNDDSTVNQTFISVLEMPGIASNVYQYTSNSYKTEGGFFPLDSLNPGQATMCNLWPYWSSKFFPSCVGDQYLFPPFIKTGDCGLGQPISGGCWVKNLVGRAHNNFFTDEIHYAFTYDGNTSLQFLGDHDVFVFINGVLVLDLGSNHSSLPGKVTISGNPGNAAVIEGGCLDSAGNLIGAIPGSTLCSPSNGTWPTAKSPEDFRTRNINLGLEPGKVYEIAVFGAKRAGPGSDFQITLNGFTTKRSVCTPGP